MIVDLAKLARSMRWECTGFEITKESPERNPKWFVVQKSQLCKMLDVPSDTQLDCVLGNVSEELHFGEYLAMFSKDEISVCRHGISSTETNDVRSEARPPAYHVNGADIRIVAIDPNGCRFTIAKGETTVVGRIQGLQIVSFTPTVAGIEFDIRPYCSPLGIAYAAEHMRLRLSDPSLPDLLVSPMVFVTGPLLDTSDVKAA